MEVNEKVYDITIIGGGPARLIYRILWRYETGIRKNHRKPTAIAADNYPPFILKNTSMISQVFPKCCAQELVNNLKEQMAKVRTDRCLGTIRSRSGESRPMAFFKF